MYAPLRVTDRLLAPFWTKSVALRTVFAGTLSVASPQFKAFASGKNTAVWAGLVPVVSRTGLVEAGCGRTQVHHLAARVL